MTHNERFTRKNYSIWDNVENEEFYELHYRYECDDMCRELNKYEDKVNELSEENQQLKKELQQAKKLIKTYSDENSDLTIENERLKKEMTKLGIDHTEEITRLEKENEELKKELFESEKEYIIETYSDNSVRRNDKLQSLKEEFKERFGEMGWLK